MLVGIPWSWNTCCGNSLAVSMVDRRLRVTGQLKSMLSLEYIRVKGAMDKQMVRQAGTRARLVLNGHPFSFLDLPGDGNNEPGGNGGGFRSFIRAFQKLMGKSIRLGIAGTRPLG